MDPDQQLIIETFAVQSEEGLVALEQALVDLEGRPDDDETLNLIFRIAHTLKGDSAILGFSTLADLAHALEDLLESLRDRVRTVDGKIITLLLEAVDALRSGLDDAVQGRDAESATTHDVLIAKLLERPKKWLT